MLFNLKKRASRFDGSLKSYSILKLVTFMGWGTLLYLVRATMYNNLRFKTLGLGREAGNSATKTRKSRRNQKHVRARGFPSKQH